MEDSLGRLTTLDSATSPSGYQPIPFHPIRLLKEGGAGRQRVVIWLLACAIAIPSSLFTLWFDWNGVEIHVAGVTIHLTLYLPLVICVPLVLWYGFLWGAIPAYLSTFAVSLISGMPLPWIFLFAFANPLGLAMFTAVYRATNLRTDLRGSQSFLGFVLAALISSLAGSAGSFVWAYTNELGLNSAYPVWQGWWLGGWLQALFIVAPILYLLGPYVRRIQVNEAFDSSTISNWRIQLLLATTGALAALMGYVAVARLFSMNELQTAMLQIQDQEVRNQVFNAIDGLSYPIFILVTVMVTAALFAYRAALQWNRTLLIANEELANSNQRLQELATIDPLTGVSNRRHVMEALLNSFARSSRADTPLCVIMVDADHFKRINDLYGHLAGDSVLQELSQRIRDQLRDYDHFGRYGGEEFILVLPDTNVEKARLIAERLRTAVNRSPVSTEYGDIPVTISIGMAMREDQDATPTSLVDRADQALLSAKEKGRNRVVLAA